MLYSGADDELATSPESFNERIVRAYSGQAVHANELVTTVPHLNAVQISELQAALGQGDTESGGLDASGLAQALDGLDDADIKGSPGASASGTVALSAPRPAASELVPWPLMDEAVAVEYHRLIRPIQPPKSAFAGYRFPPEVILIAVRWYLRYGLSYRDLEELLAERGVEVDHVTLFRWVQRLTPILMDAAKPCRHSVGGHWFVDETYVKVSGSWRYVYRAVDQYGQVIDVFVSKRRDLNAATKFFATAILSQGAPIEVTTDRAHALVRFVADLLPDALHDTTRYANNRVEADHGRLKARLRPMRGLKRDRTASIVIRGHAIIQNLRRGHYELGVEALPGLVLVAAFDELALVV